MSNGFFKKIIYSVCILILSAYPLMGYAGDQIQKSTATQHRFDDIKFWVKIFEDPARDAWQKPEAVVRTLNLKPGDVVADIGAGTGYFTRHFAVAVGPGGKALGLEISSSMVQHMKEDAQKLSLPNYEARMVKTDDPEIEPKSVDVIFLCDTYHHIENRTVYFKRVSGSLRANGRVVIVDFYDKPLPVGPQEEGHKLSEEKVIKEMTEAGYRLIKSHDLLPYQYFLEFAL